MLIG
ncbi:Protein of unknown function [Leuconostoc citreum]|jgi:hypothetical protein